MSAEMVWSCKKDGGRKESKVIFEMRLEGKFGHNRSCITWEDRIGKLGQKHGRTMVQMKKMSEDISDGQKWILQDYLDIWKGKGTEEGYRHWEVKI